jgi:hypothetical protein
MFVVICVFVDLKIYQLRYHDVNKPVAVYENLP